MVLTEFQMCTAIVVSLSFLINNFVLRTKMIDAEKSVIVYEKQAIRESMTQEHQRKKIDELEEVIEELKANISVTKSAYDAAVSALEKK